MKPLVPLPILPAPLPVQKSFLDFFDHRPTTQGLADRTTQGSHSSFPAAAPVVGPDSNIRPRMQQAPVAQPRMSPFNHPRPNRPLASIEEGADRIATLFLEEHVKIEAHFSGLLLGLQQELAVERYEKQYLWKRVQELEAELHSLRTAGVDQKESGFGGEGRGEIFAQVNADYPSRHASVVTDETTIDVDN